MVEGLIGESDKSDQLSYIITGSSTIVDRDTQLEGGGGEAMSVPDDNIRRHSTPTPKEIPIASEKCKNEKNEDRMESQYKRGLKVSWSEWSSEDIGTMTMVPTLLLQAFATGVLDATTYADFLTFASNQTGNTILLCVAAIGTTTASSSGKEEEQARLVLTAVSLGTFLVCAAVFGHLGHFMGTRRRSWLIVTNFIQLIMLLIALLLITPISPSQFNINGQSNFLPLALFAGMSGAQVSQARQSGSAELPTAPMTSSYVDLMADKYLFKRFNHPKAGPRNRRVGYIGVMIIGAMLGAVVHRYAGSWVVVLITLALKVLVTVWICFLKGEGKREVRGECVA